VSAGRDLAGRKDHFDALRATINAALASVGISVAEDGSRRNVTTMMTFNEAEERVHRHAWS
jgi:hypothetical protein